MQSIYVFVVTALRFNVLLHAKAENFAPGKGDPVVSGQHLAKRAVRIRCPASSFSFENFVQLPQPGKEINLSQLTKSDDSPSDSSSSFLNHVLAVNSQIYKCNSPIIQAPRRFFSRTRRGLDEAFSNNPPSLNTDLNVMFDCLTTRHTIRPESGRKSVVILSSNSPELWEFSKLVTGDDCQLVSLNSYAPLVQEPKFNVRGAVDVDDTVYNLYEGYTQRSPGRRRKVTTTPVPVPLARDIEYPEAFKAHESTWNNCKDSLAAEKITRKRKKVAKSYSAIPPVRPRIVQQSEKRVQIEWRNPQKGVPVDYYRVQYMKDDSNNKWLPCHEGNLGSRVRSFRFDNLMLYRRYKFRILAHYENDEQQFSAPTTWFKLEKWE